MRISRRTSGGRGEYEISEQSDTGLTPTDILGRRIFIVFDDDWVVDSGLQLTDQGDKRRLRRLNARMQLQRQVAAALLMPHSVRSDKALGRGVPLLQSNRFAIEHVEVEDVQLVGRDQVRMRIREIILLNLSHHAEQLGYRQRLADLERIWQNHQVLPEYLSALIQRHQGLVKAGGPVPPEAETLTESLQHLMTENVGDLGILYRNDGLDAVPDLIQTLNAAQVPPAPPISVGEVDPEETEIRRRTVKEWKRWVASRGAASARFRLAVRQAWNSTCAICGLHLPATAYNAVAGVDAAHILPWADYDLDHVSNGICLCKHHHWAFDEGLIVIRFLDDCYRVEVPDQIAQGIATENPGFSLASLRAHEGPIPQERLPRLRDQRPRPQYLDQLRESG